MKKLKLTAAVCTLLASTLMMAGCEKDCACEPIELLNFCLTNNGSRDLPDSLIYVRETAGKPGVDTLDTRFGCFPESIGKHRAAAYSGDSLVYRSEWVTTDVEACCHAKSATVDLDL